MKYVYLLRSLGHPDQHYTGLTSDVQERLKAHNARKVPHTSKYVPWRVVVSIWFEDDARAAEFERYLKSGSGRAFLKKHLL